MAHEPHSLVGRLRFHSSANGDPETRSIRTGFEHPGEYGADRHVARSQFRVAAVRTHQRGISDLRCVYAAVAAPHLQAEPMVGPRRGRGRTRTGLSHDRLFPGLFSRAESAGHRILFWAFI